MDKIYYRLVFSSDYSKVVIQETTETPRIRVICGVRFSSNCVFDTTEAAEKLKESNIQLRAMIGE